MEAEASAELTAAIKRCAESLGFALVGIAPARPFTETRAHALARLRAGHFTGMDWYTAERIERGTRPAWLLTDARSLISLALPYYVGEFPQDDSRPGEPHGIVSRYAWGRDYHLVLRKKLTQLVTFLQEHDANARFYADTGPVLDRAVAFRAGVGWYGKHTNLLTREHGSWVFLAEVLTDRELVYDTPLRKTCGRCTRCSEACPTGAIVAPYQVDARRCIAYLTIENRGGIPRELRPLIGTRVFGCDICQDVCPVNRDLAAAGDVDFLPRPGIGPSIPLLPLLNLTEEEFTQRFAGTALKRARRRGLVRNAIVALGNSRDPVAIPHLARILLNPQEDPMLRGHAAWALGQFPQPAAHQALLTALEQPLPAEVRAEVALALEESPASQPAEATSSS